jgi:hypothetical protein
LLQSNSNGLNYILCFLKFVLIYLTEMRKMLKFKLRTELAIEQQNVLNSLLATSFQTYLTNLELQELRRMPS